MKIVFLNASGQLGGVENVLLDLCASVRVAEPSWRMHLIAPADGALVERARALKVEATVLPFPHALARLGDAGAGGNAGRALSRAALARRALAATPATIGYTRALRRLLRTLAPDVIHSHSFKTHVLAAWARGGGSGGDGGGALKDVPVVWHVHDYVACRPLMSRLLRLSASRCDAVVANSHSVADDVRATFGGGMEVRTIYNAINLQRFAPEGATLDLDALAGMNPAEPGTVRVGLVATLARWKGHRVFLEALSHIPAHLNVRAYVIGDALYQTEGSQYTLDELRRMASEFGVADRVGFTGFVAGAAEAMRALDVVVHASTAPEPFGLVIAEAMSCGRAVVASAAGGAAEIITDGVDALAHTPGDARSLAACITRLACDAPLRARLGTAARATAVRRFNHTRLASEWTPIYRELSNRREGSEATNHRAEGAPIKDELRADA